MFGWIRKKKQSAHGQEPASTPAASDSDRLSPSATLEERLAALATCGITPHPEVSDELVQRAATGGWVSDEADKLLLLLCALGGESDQPGLPPGVEHLSDTIWYGDSECIEGDGSYVRIAERMRALSQGDLPLEEIEDSVEDGDSARLAFRLDGESTRWDLECNDDWIDPEVFSRFAKLLTRRATGRRFTSIDLGGQDFLIGCATPAEREQLRKISGLRVDWLK